MSGFYPLVRQLHVALRLPNMSLILLGIGTGRFISNLHTKMAFNSPIV